MPSPASLLPQVYAELRKLTAAKLAHEKPGHTFNATALAHKAFLKLVGERSYASKSLRPFTRQSKLGNWSAARST
jgi:hypothetical protein